MTILFFLKAANLLSETGQILEAGLAPSNQSTDFLHSSAPVPTATFIAKTVDYGHGRGQYIFCLSADIILNVFSQTILCFHLTDPGATVERISYGERIVLRPAPPPSERLYEKGWFCSVNIGFVCIKTLGLFIFICVFFMCDELLFFVRTAWP